MTSTATQSEKRSHRIKSYNRYVYRIHQMMVCVGGAIAFLSSVFFYFSTQKEYLLVTSGLGMVSLIWMLRYGWYIFIKKGKISKNDAQDAVMSRLAEEQKELRGGKYLFGTTLVIMVVACLIIVFSGGSRTLLAALIPWILLVGVEFVLVIIHIFRLGLLEQEIR